MMHRRGFLALGALPLLGQQLSGRQLQLSAEGRRIWLTYGNGLDAILKSSDDLGKSWVDRAVYSGKGKLMLGMRRGPRYANGVVSGIANGDLWAWREGSVVRVNDVANSAREGLHAMAAGGGKIYAAWLDLRTEGMKLYGSISSDGGKSWSPNLELYASPDGTICQCCHPSLLVDTAGKATVMFRNALGGMRDMYTMEWGSKPVKLGSGSWKINACPMDGGGMVRDGDGKLVTVWRRDTQVFLSRPGSDEELLGSGKQPVIVRGKEGLWVAWAEGKSIVVRSPDQQKKQVGEGAFVSMVARPDGGVLLGWENEGQLSFATAEPPIRA
ncbi:exo-alpha-sialidase [Bryobacter aggregatus]|uniref:exo-alpha-sialidase n=1 Tax=Bryobacter aggregatus TaxID=360054 RepID=UPI0012BAA8DA|nr:exo-alpha-sialidase [Bryobacter aggregatus]